VTGCGGAGPSSSSTGSNQSQPLNTASNSKFSIYFQNVNRARGKTSELFLSVSECDYDIIILLETNFCEGIYNEEIFDNRFLVYRCDRDSVNSTKKMVAGL
jgi:hypothetical protein